MNRKKDTTRFTPTEMFDHWVQRIRAFGLPPHVTPVLVYDGQRYAVLYVGGTIPRDIAPDWKPNLAELLDEVTSTWVGRALSNEEALNHAS